MNIGAHVSISEGIDKAPEQAAKWGCEAMQIFTRSPQGGPVPPISDEKAAAFKENCQKFGIKAVYIHAPYYINLASKNNRVYYGSISSIRKELERATLLGAKYVMTHIGSAKEAGEGSIKLAVKGLEKIFDGYGGSASLLIENSAGAGQIIGSRFEDISEIFASFKDQKYLAGVCLDTQHSFASGFDWKNKFEESLGLIDKNFGVDKIKLMHANDSATDLNSHLDRHAHIGKGKIGLEGFEKLVRFAKEKNIDMICETNYPGVVEDIETLKEIRDEF
ncbi:deoxyribonuclease IV [Candidatus Parcubacteria bacterium]|nr:MAG: deoxyribonuclease IV [Candidatus Parcubacteria bacterium]